MNIIYSSKQLLNEIEETEFYIFGTGFVAERFFETIRTRNLDENIKSFITSQPSSSCFKEKSVKGIDELTEVEKEQLVCIAVHEVIAEEIISELKEKGYKKLVWIYPILFDLWYGKPVRKNILVLTNDILRTCTNDYRIAIREMVIDEYYGKNKIGYNLYKKLQEVHSSKHTAEKRLNAFIKLIDSWNENGYAEGSILKIDENNEIFDGVHRLALAYYHKLPKVRCDIYSTIGKKQYVNDEIKITKNVIEMIDLTEDEMISLEKYYHMLKEDICT